MDEYLSEKEQIDQLKRWWKENGWYLIGGVVIASFGYYGYQQYQSWQAGSAEAAAAIYHELRLELADDDRAAADALLASLAAEHAGSPYLDQSRLLIAEANLVRDTNRSVAELEAVVAGADNPGMVNIARLRLARVLAYQEQYDRALAVLDVPDAGEFAARFAEIRGDIQAALGNREAATSAYTEALIGAGNGSVNSEFVQLKLSEIFQLQAPTSGAVE